MELGIFKSIDLVVKLTIAMKNVIGLPDITWKYKAPEKLCWDTKNKLLLVIFKCGSTFFFYHISDLMCLLPDPQWLDAQEGSWEGLGAGQKDRGSPQEKRSAHEEVQGEDRCSQAREYPWYSGLVSWVEMLVWSMFLFIEVSVLLQACQLVTCFYWVSFRRWRRTRKGQRRKEWHCRAARPKLMI